MRLLVGLLAVSFSCLVTSHDTPRVVCCDDAPRVTSLRWTASKRKVAVSRAFADDGRQGLAYILRQWGAREGVEIGVKDAFFSNILVCALLQGGGPNIRGRPNTKGMPNTRGTQGS